MKYIALYIFALQIVSCVSVDGGSTISPDMVNISDVQGCYYDEYRSTYTSLGNTYLSCRKVCVVSDSVYTSFIRYIGNLSEDSSQYIMSSIDESQSEVGTIKVINPDVDGTLEYNLIINNGLYSGYYNYVDQNEDSKLDGGQWRTFSKNGWDLCFE